jgi:hypothetical protein
MLISRSGILNAHKTKSRIAFPGNPAVFFPVKRPVAFRPHLTEGLALFLNGMIIPLTEGSRKQTDAKG